MDELKYSVIVPAYQAEATIGDCVRALNAQTVPRACYEIIVVDDGSTDRTADVARQAGADQVLTISNQGPGGARNAGVAVSKGPLLLFTDADCEPVPAWIERITAPFADPEVVGGKGIYRSRQPELVARFVQLEYEDKYLKMARQTHIDFIDTYSAAYRRDVFLTNGGFDPLLRVDEDQEFSFRLSRKGYHLIFIPEAVVYHRHVTSILKYGKRKFTIGYWKALLLRWHPERVVSDSHTPQTLKMQIALLAMLGVFLLFGLWLRPFLWLALACGVFFLGTAFPFLTRILKKDATVLAVAPLLLVVRALALGLGLSCGFLRFFREDSARQAPISGLNRVLKRTLDIALSLIAMVLALPLLAILGVAIKLDSPGPVFFVQERAGENGRPFRCFKLRTMVDGAETMLPELVDLDALAASPAFKLKNDPRVTSMGHFLRRTGLDELPQLWNVLKGEMSLVGPRPEEMRIVQLYNDWHRQRLAVKPGITGPMQVSGRGDLDLDERVRLELDYIHNYSLWKDLGILARTVGAVVSGRGAY